MTLNFGQRLSRAVWFTLIGAALVAVAHRVAPLKVSLVLDVLLAVEAWLLWNRYADDTLSESQWAIATRPLVPWLFGIATGWAIATGLLINPWLVLSAGAVQAHFFWQSWDVYERLLEAARQDAAAQARR